MGHNLEEVADLQISKKIEVVFSCISLFRLEENTDLKYRLHSNSSARLLKTVQNVLSVTGLDSQLCGRILRTVCVFKISKCLSHYTLAVFAAYLCFFFLAEPNTSLSLFPDWLSPPPVPPAALGIVLTSGCATSRHCQQQELPGVRIHCCDSDLCNSAPSWRHMTLHYISAVLSLLLLRMFVLWYGVTQHQWTMEETFSISASHLLS